MIGGAEAPPFGRHCLRCILSIRVQRSNVDEETTVVNIELLYQARQSYLMRSLNMIVQPDASNIDPRGYNQIAMSTQAFHFLPRILARLA